MNLTGITSFRISYVVDADTNLLTMTFLESDGITVIGAITIEKHKAKALMEMLSIMASERALEDATSVVHRFFYSAKDGLAGVEFA